MRLFSCNKTKLADKPHAQNKLGKGVFGLSVLSSFLLLAYTQPASADLPVPLANNHTDFRWDGASLPTQPYGNQYGGQSIDINQFGDRAILHWESFDVSKNNGVNFIQPNAASIALNRVLGDSDAASIINGHVTANGRIYIINHNGIIFGQNSVVNARELVASTLDIRDDVFLNTGIEYAYIDGELVPAFSRDTDNPDAMGEILFEQGAQVSIAENGRVMVFAPKITNKGDISAEQGQIIMAASEDEVFLAPAGDDDDVRGLIVGVNTGGEVSNIGKLIAERGNISLLGLAVNQEGLARATTSTSLNGSVILRAQDFNNVDTAITATDDGATFREQRAGTVILAEGSVTEVLPGDDGSTATDIVEQKISKVLVEGRNITLESGSTVVATGGDIQLSADATPGLPGQIESINNPDVLEAGITVRSGAVIDASGDDTTVVSVARNYIEVEARGNELADAPLQRGGALEGETLVVDVRKGSDLLNIDAALASIERDVHERLAPGGTVALQAVGNIVVEQGALIDISGGYVAYTEDYVSPSLLVTASGDIQNISEAERDLQYIGVLNDFEVEHDKWGVTEEFNSAFGFVEQGYIHGFDSGSLTLNAPGIQFDGDIQAAATAGIHQLRAPEALGEGVGALQRAYNQVPLGGQLVVRHLNAQLQDIIIGEHEDVIAENGHPDSSVDPLVLSAGIFDEITRVDIDNTGRVIINRPLEMQAFSELDLLGTQVLVESDIRSPGGSVDLAATLVVNGISLNTEPQLTTRFPELIDATSTLVKVDAEIDVSGTWVNDSAVLAEEFVPQTIITDGGQISLLSGNDLVVTESSMLNVSAGAHLNRRGGFSGGDGGAITLVSADADETVRTNSVISDFDVRGELQGYGFDKGGELVLQAESIRIQHDVAVDVDVADTDEFVFDAGQQFSQQLDGSGRNVLLVDADTFNRGGFQSFELVSVGRPGGSAAETTLEIIDDTRIELKQASMTISRQLRQAASMAALVDDIDPLELIRSGASFADFTDIAYLPEYERQAVDLALAAEQSTLSIGTGAVIRGETGSSVSITSDQAIWIDGEISTPAGEIVVALTDKGLIQDKVQSRVHLGDNARLYARGAVLLDPVEELGLQTGEVFDAGKVMIDAFAGSVFSASGAEINVDAASYELVSSDNDILTSSLTGGNAGSIEFNVAESFVYQGRLSARPAEGRQGGSLKVVFDANDRTLGVPNPTGFAPVVESEYFGEYTAVLGAYDGELPAFSDNLDDSLRGKAYIPVDTLAADGFDALEVSVVAPLKISRPVLDSSIPVIEFTSETGLTLDRSIVLDAAVIRATGDFDIALEAPYVALGYSDQESELQGNVYDLVISGVEYDKNPASTLDIAVTGGDARLLVEAEMIELIGELVTQGACRLMVPSPARPVSS